MKSLYQFLTYLVIGVLSALIDVGTTMLLISEGVGSIWSLTVGFFSGLSLNFVLHAKITFKSRCTYDTLIRYSIVVLANYVITIVVSWLFDFWLGSLMIGKVVSLPLVAFSGYLLGKHWIFKR